MQDKGQGQLVEKLPKTLGFGMGLEFREASLLLSSKSQNVVKAGMIFNVSVGKGPYQLRRDLSIKEFVAA